MKIEDIKVRLNNLSKRGLDGYTAKEDFQVNAESDIEYLLSIIEQATTFFEMVEEGQYPGEMNALEVASKYLKAIRGN